jgi:hypothetical protein
MFALVCTTPQTDHKSCRGVRTSTPVGHRLLDRRQMVQEGLLGVAHDTGLLGLSHMILASLQSGLGAVLLGQHLGALLAVVVVVEHPVLPASLNP